LRQTTTQIKKAVIITGEMITNLAPLTNYCPGYLLPVLNKPLIQYTIDFLKNNGFDELLISLTEESTIPDFLKEKTTAGINISYHKEPKPRGTAGAIKDLEQFLNGEPFLVINSNIFIKDIDLISFLDCHRESNSIITAGVYKENGIHNINENVLIEKDNSIRSFNIIHPSVDRRSPWKSAGIYIFEPQVLKYINPENYMDIKEQLIPILQREELNISACEIEGSFKSINNVQDYIHLNRSILMNGLDQHYEDMKELANNIWVGKNVKISPQAYILGPVIIGDNCTIEDFSHIIGPAVIGNACQISQDVLFRESIVWGGVSLSQGSKLEYSIIGEKATIPNNSNIRNMIALNGLKFGDMNLLPSDYGIRSTADLRWHTPIKGVGYKTLKRITDLIISSLGLFLLIPLFVLIALAIKIDSPGPVFYRQKRCGRNGKLFNMTKFRTMVTNAEVLHKELISKKEIDGPMFKISNDPRITGIGKFLRRTSLDEFPQLWNVIKGEMSLVGPRPLIMDEMKFSPSWRDIRLKVKPGLTGLWQIHGRSSGSFHDWIKYDLSYVKNQSFWLDIKILFKTISVVLKKIGAY
jgi:lipopolysaccharide/colanic/teichoic acid biosynthesis glycosyltransferase/dTDP-glucose pyrophosphorylase